MSMYNIHQQQHHRRKPSQPRHLQLFLDEQRSADELLDSAEVIVEDASEEEPLNLQVRRRAPQSLLAPRLEGIVVSVSELSADLMLTRQSLPPGASDYHVKDALGHLAAARYRLMDALGCLQSLDLAPASSRFVGTDEPAREKAEDEKPPGGHVAQTGEKLQHYSDSGDTECTFPSQQALRRASAAKRRWNKDMVDEAYVPHLSPDGTAVILSKEHPVAALPVCVYQRLLDESRGAATLHLRALLKHFFTRDVLAESSVTGAGTYKRALDRDIVQGVCDYIQNRYPGAMSESRMRLCCTDVCVQARRRRAKPNNSAQHEQQQLTCGPLNLDPAASGAVAEYTVSMAPNTTQSSSFSE